MSGSEFFVFRLGSDVIVSLRVSSIYYVRLVGSTVEIQYGQAQKQTVTMSRYYNEKPLMELCKVFGIPEEEVNRQWFGSKGSGPSSQDQT